MTIPLSFQPRLRSWGVAFGLLLLPALAFAQSGYVFTKIIDDQTIRPDGKGDFYIGFPGVTPSLDGNKVLFQDITANDNSLWTADASGEGFVKIADFDTSVPGGMGTFTRFNDQVARVQDGIVLFEGLDSNFNVRPHGGLYQAPANGGAVAKIFDYHTTAPESGFSFYQSNGNNQITDGVNVGDYDLENGLVAFHAITDGDAQGDNADGIYTIHLDGTGITLLANRSINATPTPFPANQYYSVALHGGTAVFDAATVFGPYGIFAAPLGGPSTPRALATPDTGLPGSASPGKTSYYVTSTQPAFNRFDHVTGDLVFAAHDASGDNGLYAILPGAGTLTKIVDNQTALPGAAAPGAYFDGSPFSANGGQVAFLTPGDTSALYVANADGSITRVVGVGDVLDGITLTGLTLGAHALSDGRVVFGAGSFVQGHDGNARYGAIFVATPAALVPAISSAGTASGQVGSAFSYQITADKSPTSFGATGLPAGLSVAASSGLISGVPTAVGTFVVTLSASNASATGTATLTLTIADALPVVTLSAVIPSVTAGSGLFGEYLLTLSSPASTDLQVAYTVKGSAVNGTDYTLLKGTKKIKAGKTSKPLKVFPLGDLGGGGKKALKLTLAPGNGYTVGTPTFVKIKILPPAQ